jgi:type I restriction enzyme R subunit
MNEAETRAELIDPALVAAGWGVVDRSIIRREYSITQGRLQGAGKRGQSLSADYLLIHNNTNLAVIEAKKRALPVTEGVAQAKDYAKRLHIRYTYSTNGDGIYQIDMATGAEKHISHYPSPEELWSLTFAEQDEWRDRFAAIPFEDRGGTWQGRYYQDVAVEKVMQAVADGEQRMLLTMATGTGKTFVAFQIAWKLFQSRWNLSRDAKRRPRILFLADRNILADQAFNSFSAFAEDALIRIDPAEIRKKGAVPKNGNLFFTIFQTFMSGKDGTPYFGDYPADFFDFIVIDECHRGGANDESSWRAILDYFSPAVQLGLTATPRRKGNVDTYAYFGDPIYTYSLKEGINDGFLTPFRVVQIATTLDDYVYTNDDEIIEGEVEEGKRYTEDEFNRIIEIEAREQYRVKLLLEKINQSEKTLVFCASQLHALAVRDLINQHKTSSEPNYCVRVTADDGKLGEQALRTFQDNEKSIPTILTTSKKLSTGVDARNVRNIVLMRPVNDMVEFKQIIGRGTRLFDGKDYFTIYDFVKAYERFNDDDWDGDPIPHEPCSKCNSEPCICDKPPHEPCSVCGERPCQCEKPEPPICDVCGRRPCECKKKKKVKIKLANGKERLIQNMSVTTFWGEDGKPISAAQFLQLLYGELPELFKDEDELRQIWSSPDSRALLLHHLAEKDFGKAQLDEMKKLIDAVDSDIFDVLAYVAFNMPPISRLQRVVTAKGKIASHYDYKQQAFLDFVLSKYADEGVDELAQQKLPSLLELKYHAISDAAVELGSITEIRNVFVGFQKYLYEQHSEIV